MIRKIFFLVILIFIFNCGLFAQKEAYNWFFGTKAGITFNTKTLEPVVLKGGQLVTDEGCSTISDKDGNLLFYTDGVSVWNRKHKKMPRGTGLLGHYSSAQSAIIVPKPKDDSTYYIFTTDWFDGTNGLCYSTVNMNLDSGMGDVTQKNTQIFKYTTEQLFAVRHDNNDDIWVISHEKESNTFNAYLVNEYGIKTKPVVSETGETFWAFAGFMKSSPNGSKFACLIYELRRFEIFDFDIETGMFSNPVRITPPQLETPYACEFSPDNTKLYISTLISGRIYQYDLTAGSEKAIEASAVLLTDTKNTYGGLQLGPNKKIYVSSVEMDYLSVINNPNIKGTGCNFVQRGLSLDSGSCLHGLTAFINNFDKPKAKIQSNSPLCYGNDLILTIQITGNVKPVSYQWSGPNGFSSIEKSPIIKNFDDSMLGWYYLTVVDKYGKIYNDSLKPEILDVKLSGLENIDFGKLCYGTQDSKIITLNNAYKGNMRVASIQTNNSSSVFVVDSSYSMYFLVKSGEKIEIPIKFIPQKIGTYLDTILIEISEPCRQRFSLVVKGIYMPLTNVWLPDTTVEIGREYCIPIMAKLTDNLDTILKLSYTAEVRFDAYSFMPDTPEAGVIESGERVVFIQGSNLSVSNNETNIGEICGTVLTPKDKAIPWRITKFEWNNPDICLDSVNGGLQLKQFLCQYNLGKVQFFSPPDLKISPNPAGGLTEIKLMNIEQGSVSLELYNVLGERLIARNWNSNKEIPAYAGMTNTTGMAYSAGMTFTVDLSDFSDGIYYFTFRSKSNIVTKQLLISK